MAYSLPYSRLKPEAYLHPIFESTKWVRYKREH
jgi:hypothetical protein